MTAKGRPLSYWVSLARMGFEDDLYRLMEGRVQRSDLARAIGTSAAYITKILNGNANYTLQTMAKLASAVDGVLQVRIAKEDEVVRVLPIATALVIDTMPRPSLEMLPTKNQTLLPTWSGRVLRFPLLSSSTVNSSNSAAGGR